MRMAKARQKAVQIAYSTCRAPNFRVSGLGFRFRFKILGSLYQTSRRACNEDDCISGYIGAIPSLDGLPKLLGGVRGGGKHGGWMLA